MSALMNTYARLPVSFSHGRGAVLFDAGGREYLDGLSGIAVTNLGHAHPRVTAAIEEQARQFLHCSNIFCIDAQEQAGEALVARAGMESVFFSNSGAEANEAAIKIARLHAHQRDISEPKVVVLDGAFHGRTLATLTASGSRRIQAGFEPLVSGFIRAPRNDLAALAAIAERNQGIAALMLEPVQGESGIHPLDREYLAGAARLCRERGWLLIYDEVQSGNGRTGSFFYYQQTGTVPDIVTTAKALGNGVPIGACIARGAAARAFAPGHHGSTYGGNPLACAAAVAVLETLAGDTPPETAGPVGDALMGAFDAALRHPEAVVERRRAGLMIGVELAADCPELAGKALEAGLLLNVTAGRTLRLLPPLVMSEAQAAEFGGALADVVSNWWEARAALPGAA